MYKILIRNRELEEAESPAYEKYSIYCEDNKEFETDDLNNALNKMNELLDKFLRVDLSLISKIEVNSELTTNLLKIVDISSNMISIINDGKTFSFKIDLSSLDEYTIVNVNNEIFDEVKTYLESLGFTNVRLIDTFEIVADNNTNNKIEGTITVKQYDKTYYIPIGTFNNMPDRTTFLRDYPENWDPEAVKEIEKLLRNATDKMWENYKK